MRVLAECGQPKLWFGTYECTGNTQIRQTQIPCHRILQVDETDVMYTHLSKTNTEDTETAYGFVCYKCGTFTLIPKSDLPRTAILNAMRWRGGQNDRCNYHI